MKWKRKGEHICLEQDVDTCKMQMEMHTEFGKGRDWDFALRYKKRAWCTQL